MRQPDERTTSRPTLSTKGETAERLGAVGIELGASEFAAASTRRGASPVRLPKVYSQQALWDFFQGWGSWSFFFVRLPERSLDQAFCSSGLYLELLAAQFQLHSFCRYRPTPESIHPFRVLPCPSVANVSHFGGCGAATRMTASKAGFARLSPSNSSGRPWDRHELASLGPQKVTISIDRWCLTNARNKPS